jgi:hypothetical protein
MSNYHDDGEYIEVDAPRHISRAEQEQTGMVKRSTYVPAQPPAIEIPYAGETQQVINEATSPVQRAVATAISSAFWGLLVVPLGLVLIWLTDADPATILLTIVACVLAVGYMFLCFDRQAHEHSPAGVALHDRELTHEERIHELNLRYGAYHRMIDHLLQREGEKHDWVTKRNDKHDTLDLVLTKAEKLADANHRLTELARQLQAENRKLRRLTHMEEHMRMVRKAHKAALRLAALHLAGLRTGRRVVYRSGGISERTFFYAKALCELASIYADGEFMTDDPDMIEANLVVVAKSAERDFWLLLRRMPPSRRPQVKR